MSAPFWKQRPSRPSQRYAERRAAPELDEHVACIWLLEVADDGPAYEHRTVPNGCVEIASVLGTGVVRVAGPKHAPTLERVEPGQAVVGVRLRPGTALACSKQRPESSSRSTSTSTRSGAPKLAR
jgi:hypothetical protein